MRNPILNLLGSLVAVGTLLIACSLNADESLIIETKIVDGIDASSSLTISASSRAGEISGFILAVEYNPDKASLMSFEVSGEWSEKVTPDFYLATGTESHPGFSTRDSGLAALMVIMDLIPDDIEKSIPSTPDGEPQPIAELNFQFAGDASLPFRVQFLDNEIGFDSNVPLINSLVIDGVDFYQSSEDTPLKLTSGGLRTEIDEVLFRRGDVNSDGTGDISDPITGLTYLFIGGVKILCLDAADTNDDGKVDISDQIYILTTLFLGGRDPAPPGIRICGPDPTDDDLAPCEYPQDLCDVEGGDDRPPIFFPIF